MLQYRLTILGVRGDYANRPTLEPETPFVLSTDTPNARREFMGRVLNDMHFRTPFLLQATSPASFAFSMAIDLAL